MMFDPNSKSERKFRNAEFKLLMIVSVVFLIYVLIKAPEIMM